MNLAERLMVYQGNVLPPLLKKLSQQLHVSIESLTALGIGYALRIPLKDDKEFYNCWVFPERDERGAIIGLSLRQWDGKKWMVPGSKRGLIYVPNVHVSPIDPKVYQAGPQNWVRTSEDNPCPICGKSDWCLLSSENPNDPKAALCGRVREGATKNLGDAGYLHIRKETGNLTPASGAILVPSKQPVLIVEGVTCTAAGLDLGYLAVGRPSAGGSLDKLPSLIAGRSVIVLGENDAGAGKEGMDKAFEILQPHAKKIIKFLPPKGIKDLRQWVCQGLTRGQFQRVAQTIGSTVNERIILSSIAPLDLAKQWLETAYFQEKMFTLKMFHGSWFAYNGKCYSEISRTHLRQELYQFLDGKQHKKLRPNGFDVIKYDPTKRKIDEVADALLAFCPITSETIPCWIGDNPEKVDPRHVLVFPNGWLNITEYLRDRNIPLHKLTPRFFSLTCYPYDFDPNATCVLWKKFLREVFPTHPTKIALLQEWFGYNLIPDNSYEKFMLFLGPTRAGKSTILDVLTYILGSSQVHATTLKSFTRRFGLYPFLGKLAAVIGDVSSGTNYDAVAALTQLKQITGNDAVTLEQKGKDITQTCIKLYARFTMAANAMPRFPDYARTIEARMLVLAFAISFAGREDTTLKARLKLEAPGILLWALEGLRRLQHRKKFTLPAAHGQALRQIRGQITPLSDFVNECCEFGKGSDITVTRNALWECWKEWAIANGEKVNSCRWLSRTLLSLYPECTAERTMKHGTRTYRFYGARLIPALAKRFEASK